MSVMGVNRISRALNFIVCLGVVFLAALTGCGAGSGSGGGGGSSNTPDFSLSVASGSLTVNQGGSQTATISSSGLNGFSGSISVSFAGLPVGVTVSPASFTLTGSASQAVQISVSSSAALVTGGVIHVQGTSGAISHQATMSLVILGPQSFTLSTPSSISLLPGTSQQFPIAINAVNGFNGLVSLSFSGLPSGVTIFPSSTTGYPGSSTTVTLTTSSTASGSGTINTAGTSGTLTASAQTPVSVSTAPDYVLSSGIYTGLSINAGSSATFSVTATSYNGFDAPVAVTLAGLPAGITASPSSFSITPTVGEASQVVTITAALTVATGQTPTITVQGNSGPLSHQTSFQMYVNAPPLSLSLQPTPLTIAAGSFAQVELAVYGLSGNNVTGTVTETLSGLPAGVTATPASATNPASAPSQVFYLQAAATGASGGNITFTAKYGPFTATTTLPVTIGPAQSGTPVALKSRSTYIRTGSTTDFGALPAPTLTLYHKATARFFSSDSYLGHLYVVDATTRKLAATLDIPGAFGIDQAPDGSSIYVGTFAGDIYVVDPMQLVVTKRIAASTISQFGFHANAVFAMANGKLLLMQYFIYPYYSWVDGNGPLALWDPSHNSIVKFVTAPDGGAMPERLSCYDHFEHLILTAGRTRAILAPVISGEGSSQLCSLDPETGTWNLSPALFDLPAQDTNTVAELASSPDGKTVVTYDETKVYVLDSTTLQIKNSFPATATRFNFVYPNMIIGTDNQTLYLNNPSEGTVLRAYNLTTGGMTGWIPQVEASSSYKWYEPSNPYMQAISDDGLIAGPLDNGIGLIDSQSLNAPPVATTFGFSALQVATGPLAGATDTDWTENQFPQSAGAPLGSVYFGSNTAKEVSYSNIGQIYADTPAGTAGPVDVRITTTDGGEQLLPEAFSYGPWILDTTTAYATADGGGTAQIFGYGFGPVTRISDVDKSYLPAPGGLSVSVGGQSATVLGYVPAPYANAYPVTQPFPTQGIEYTVPPGVAGATSPIVINTVEGSSSGQSSTLRYLPATQRFSASGSQLIDGIYDKSRDLYYFTDANQILVFSRTQARWMNPIPLPAPAKAFGPQRLYGLALSPDGSKLAVTDAGALAIYLLNPSSPSSITTYPLSGQFDLTDTPSGVAVTNAGAIYFTTFDQLGDGQFDLYKIDTTTGTAAWVTGVDNRPPQGDDYDEFGLRLAMSADGSRVYFNNDGELVYLDTATGTYQIVDQGPLGEFSGGYELVLAPDQSRLAVGGLITDSNGNGLAMQSLGWTPSYDASYVYGGAFSADGTLLFQPGVSAIDSFDGYTGQFISRVSLPFELSENYRALVSDGADDVLVAITGASGDGIAVLDLSGVARPPVRPFLRSGSFQSNGTKAVATRTRPSLSPGGQRSFSAHYRQRGLTNLIGARANNPAVPRLR